MTRLAMLLVALVLPLAALAAPGFDPFEKAGIDPRPGARVPLDLTFTDAKGRAVSLREIGGGKPIVLAPVLHDCPNICGVTLGGLANAVKAQSYRPGTDFEIVAFGIDPKETPDDAHNALAELERRFPSLAAKGGVHALTGYAKDIATVTQALGYRYAFDERIGQYAHVAAVAVLTPDGRLARWLYGIAPEPTDLHLALTEAGEGRLGDFADQLLLLCYHYDPQTGRYGSLVWSMLRVGGGITVLGLGGFIVLSLRRERREPRP